MMEEYSCNEKLSYEKLSFEKLSFEKNVVRIALPVTLQSLLQSSFSVIDQVMIGQLGSSSIAGIGLGGKFASLYAVVLAAIASAAGIMISQYMGRKDEASAAKSFYVNLGFAVVLAAGFMALCVLFPQRIMAVYTQDEMTKALAVRYIRILAVSFLPMAVSSIVTTMLRCMEKAALPLYASMFALLLNTGLNYLLIFGKWNFPQMGVEGAALASTAAQTISSFCFLLPSGKKRVRCHLWPGTAQKIRNNIKNSILQSSARCLSANFCGVWGKMSIQQSMEISEPMHARR